MAGSTVNENCWNKPTNRPESLEFHTQILDITKYLFITLLIILILAKSFN